MAMGYEWIESVVFVIGIIVCQDNLKKSIVYTLTELDIMQRPPRTTSDRLVNHRLIFLAYGIVGITQAMAGLFVYAVIMASYGW